MAEDAGFHKVAVLVVDGMGIGAQPDAREDDDRGADTLGHVAAYVGELQAPFLQWMGLGNVHTVRGLSETDPPAASVGSLRRASEGRDRPEGIRELFGGALGRLRETGVTVRGLGWLADMLGEDDLDARDPEASDDDLLHRMSEVLAGHEGGVVVAGLHLAGGGGGPVALSRRIAWLDGRLPTLMDRMDESTLLLVVGLGGADPILETHPEPTRERTPLLAYTPAVPSGVILGDRACLGDVGATLEENFGLAGSTAGNSFYRPLLA
ncbi:MAG: hypothetical protein ACQEXJ_23760 [Myxococcota bacterium]